MPPKNCRPCLRPVSTCRWTSSLSVPLSRRRLDHDAAAAAESPKQTPKLILGIESSCDDSCAAVIQGFPGSPGHSSNGNGNGPLSSSTPADTGWKPPKLLSNIVLRQDHTSTGGIHPLTASIQHGVLVPRAIGLALDQASTALGLASRRCRFGQGSRIEDHLSAIAVTCGPGMTSSLSTGLIAAKTLASIWRKPLIYVHHMAAHALTPFLTEPMHLQDPPHFPFLTLLVSGGHTMIVLANSLFDFCILATTGDDSIGDAFDKIARKLQLSWGPETPYTSPGAALEAAASAASPQVISALLSSDEHRGIMPRPTMKGQLAFSYSGLKTHFTRVIDRCQNLQQGQAARDRSIRNALAALFQRAAVAQLEQKLILALQHASSSGATPRIQSIVVSGGVASNHFLRHRLQACVAEWQQQQHDHEKKESRIRFHFPPLEFCTDNAAMVAHVGLLHYARRTDDFERGPVARWSIEDL